MIFVLEDDRGWESYYRRILKDKDLRFYRDGIAAIAGMDEEVPDLVILDVLLTGPTGFAVLNEMRSYPELMNVPVAIVSSVSIATDIAEKYGVVAVLDKGKMRPEELKELVGRYA
jgi:DNA-binding response OmpR family regulator